MSVFGEPNTFHPTVRRNFENEMEGLHQDRIGQFAAECMREVNLTEDAIRRETQRISERVARVLGELDNGLHISNPSMGGNDQSLTEAIAKRELVFNLLTGVLGTEKLTELVNASKTLYAGAKR